MTPEGHFSRPEEGLTYIHDLLDGHKGTLGLNYVSYGDQTLLASYPACVVGYDGTRREIRGTGYFEVNFLYNIFILHYSLQTSKERSTEDELELATKVIMFIHDHHDCDGQASFSFVETEQQDPIRTRTDVLVSTTLVWRVIVRVPFGM